MAKWISKKAVIAINPVTLDFEIGDCDECSRCGALFTKTDSKREKCPRCGAIMEKEDNDGLH